MLSFVAGFLMTAIPRFTSAEFAKLYEVLGVTGAIVLAGVFEFLGLQPHHHFTAGSALLMLASFGLIRFQKRQSNPPFTFIFVGIGLLLWTVSNFMIAWNLLDVRESEATFSIWKELFSSGALMAVVFGVGGRLIPGILGWEEIVLIQRQKYEGSKSFLSAVPGSMWVATALYLLSFLLNPIAPTFVGLTLRVLVTCFFAFGYWKIQRFPKDRSYLTWGIWLSCWCFVVGSFLNVFWMDRYSHSLHVILVGGFSLLTVLVATRVTLAHGSIGRGPEKTSIFIPVFTILLLFATLTRVTAVLWPTIYLRHLSYASLTWILGFLVWMIFSISKMISPKSGS